MAAALEIAGTLPDASARIETTFAPARAYEQWAAADPEQREEHYKSSLEMHSRLWLGGPRRADAVTAARNNCAQIYATLGDDARAAELFKSAAASDDPMRSFYLANFAEFLASRGQRDEAITNYEKALALKPDDVVTEARLLDLYRDARVATRLWALVGRNELDRARSLALDRLSGDPDVDIHRDLLSIVAGQDKIRFDTLRTKVPLAERPAVDPSESSVVTTTVTQPSWRNVQLRTPSDVTLDQPTGDKIAKLLGEYLAAPETQRPAVEAQLRNSSPQNSRSDLASKLKGYGVTELNDPVDGKGSVVLRRDRKTLTLAFEVKPVD